MSCRGEQTTNTPRDRRSGRDHDVVTSDSWCGCDRDPANLSTLDWTPPGSTGSVSSPASPALRRKLAVYVDDKRFECPHARPAFEMAVPVRGRGARVRHPVLLTDDASRVLWRLDRPRPPGRRAPRTARAHAAACHSAPPSRPRGSAIRAHDRGVVRVAVGDPLLRPS